MPPLQGSPRVAARFPGRCPGLSHLGLAGLQAINDKIDRLLALQEKVERNAQAIARLKTIWSFVAAGIALVVAMLRDWLLGRD